MHEDEVLQLSKVGMTGTFKHASNPSREFGDLWNVPCRIHELAVFQKHLKRILNTWLPSCRSVESDTDVSLAFNPLHGASPR